MTSVLSLKGGFENLSKFVVKSKKEDINLIRLNGAYPHKVINAAGVVKKVSASKELAGDVSEDVTLYFITSTF